MKKISAFAKGGLILLALIEVFALSSCGSILHGRRQTLPVSTNPPGAIVYVDGKFSGYTPTSVSLVRNRAHVIEIAKEGYEDEVFKLHPKLCGAVFGNAAAGVGAGLLAGAVCVGSMSTFGAGPIVIAALAGTAAGMGVDMMIGGAYGMSRNSVSVPLQPCDSQRPPPYLYE